MAEIVLDHVSKRYADGTPAVRSANFTIHDGEFFILVGPSGCGKSTLLNMIVGLEDISDGTLYVDGDRVNDLDPKDRNMAMVFQSYALYPHMTVRENMAFPLKLAKLPKAEINQRVEEAALMLELSDLLDRKPANMSGGQRQRVAMGRAIVRRPHVFLLDEPLSNLDARLRVQMRGEIAQLQKRLGITTIYVTHDQTEAMILGDRVAVMKFGEVQQVGTPRQLYEAPLNRFTAGFIGSPPMNFFPGRFNGGRLQFPMGELALPEGKVPQDERPLIAGLRPEHIRVNPAREHDVKFRAQVELCEWLGAELYVHFSVPLPPWAEAAAANNPGAFNINHGIMLTVRLDPAASVKEGSPIDLCFDPGFLHLFDGDTEEVITLPRG